MVHSSIILIVVLPIGDQPAVLGNNEPVLLTVQHDRYAV